MQRRDAGSRATCRTRTEPHSQCPLARAEYPSMRTRYLLRVSAAWPVEYLGRCAREVENLLLSAPCPQRECPDEGIGWGEIFNVRRWKGGERMARLDAARYHVSHDLGQERTRNDNDRSQQHVRASAARAPQAIEPIIGAEHSVQDNDGSNEKAGNRAGYPHQPDQHSPWSRLSPVGGLRRP